MARAFGRPGLWRFWFFLSLSACASSPTPGADGGPAALDAPGSDTPPLDASGADAPALDAPSPCPAGEAECGGSCIPVTSDATNCGACGITCAADESCMLGVCQPTTCPSGTERCAGACVDTNVDALHCGACDAPCADDEICTGGTCVPACGAPRTVCAMDGISRCVDTSSDAEHCGGCGILCPAGMGCSGGTCACRGRVTECAGVCVDTSRDLENCGGCGALCVNGACASGTCTCRAGATLCLDECVSLTTDRRHCGMCGRACARGSACVGGTCVATSCTGSLALCGGSCVDLQTDEANCGMCGRACGAGLTCAAGNCPPANDDRANAQLIVPSLSEVTVMGTTVGATFDGAPSPCACSSARNVWYRFELTSQAVVYFDTFGSGTTDTELHITTSTGALFPAIPWVGPATPGACNDDAPCTGSGWSAGASQTAATLPPGTYTVAVGSCNPGAFTLHVQMIPTSIAAEFFSNRMTVGTESENRLPIGSAGSATCGGESSGEAAHWFLSCGGEDVLLSLCRSDGGLWERNDNVFGPYRDPVMYLRSASTGTNVECNDDGGSAAGLDCRGATLYVHPVLLVPVGGLSGQHWGPRIVATPPRGLNAVIVDESESIGGLDYRLIYDRP